MEAIITDIECFVDVDGLCDPWEYNKSQKVDITLIFVFIMAIIAVGLYLLPVVVD